MVRTKAAVLPVPDCDCPIIFRALYSSVSQNDNGKTDMLLHTYGFCKRSGRALS
jgi:hypothetical protein